MFISVRDELTRKPRTKAKLKAAKLKLVRELPGLVRRVSSRVAKGIPLRLALAGEGMEPSAYEQCLERDPELTAIQEKARLEFLESAIDQLLGGEKLQSNICWLLERRYPELFVRPSDTHVQVTQQIIGVPDEILQRARDYAKGKG